MTAAVECGEDLPPGSYSSLFTMSSCDRGEHGSHWDHVFKGALCCAQLLKQCLTLCNTMDCPPGSSLQGISQARMLESIAISFSRGSSWPRDQTLISCVSCNCRWILYHWSPFLRVLILFMRASSSWLNCPLRVLILLMKVQSSWPSYQRRTPPPILSHCGLDFNKFWGDTHIQSITAIKIIKVFSDIITNEAHSHPQPNPLSVFILLYSICSTHFCLV